MVTHYLAFLPVGVIAASFGVRYWRGRNRNALIALALIGLAGLCVAPLMIRLAIKNQSFLSGFQGWTVELPAMVGAISQGFAPEPGAWGATAGWIILSLIGTALVAGLLRALWHVGSLGTATHLDLRVMLPAAIFLAHGAGLVVLAAVGDKSLTVEQMPRYVGLVLPASVMVVAYGIELLPRRAALVVMAAILVLQIPQMRLGRDFRGQTARQVAHAAGPESTVVVGAGYGRGIPASVVYELADDVQVCVILNEDSCRSHTQGVVIAKTPTQVTRKHEDAFTKRCHACRSFRIDSANLP
jgi:hypothetical protein